MASLFDRLTGLNLTVSELDQKLAIHAFAGAINELRRGKVTNADIKSMFDLTTAQAANAAVLKSLIVAAPQKVEFMRVFKDWLYLAETETDARYMTQAAFVARLQEEVTDQGGSLP